MYRVCEPDGSCSIQLALLYWLLPDSDWSPTFLYSGYQSTFLKCKRRETGFQLPQILAALRQLILKKAPPGTHVHRTLQLLHDGLTLNNNTPITHSDQYLELRTVPTPLCLVYVRMCRCCNDYPLSRVPATLYYDARFPTRTQQYSAQELRHNLSQLHRPSVLRGQHFYPFDSDPNYAQWFNQALDMIVHRLLPPPVQPQPATQPLSAMDDDPISSLSQSTITSALTEAQDIQSDQYAVSLEQKSLSDLFDTGFFHPPSTATDSFSRRSEDIHLSSSAPQEELAHLVETGQIYLGCAVQISSLSLPVNLCRPDRSCGPQLAYVILLEPGPWALSPHTPWFSPLRHGCLYCNIP